MLNAISFRKCMNPKISYIFNITLVLSFICKKSGDINDRIYKEKQIAGSCESLV